MKKTLLSLFAVMLLALTANAQHEYVDLGLPSGTLWATTNIGAINPADYGDYFAWGETEPKSDYSWSTYKWCKGSENTLTKYCTDSSYGYNGFTDGLTRLLPEDDAATVNWGSNWQMPTKVQLEELISNTYTTKEWTAKTGKEGYLNYGLLITSKANGNSIFLPASGKRVETKSASGVDIWGNYWSSNNKCPHPYASYMHFGDSDGNTTKVLADRCLGLSIRPVYVPHYRTCPDNNHPHLIDLGLPSGTKWSCCNVGASTPETFGDYFAWGETEPKNDYSWSTYKWCKGSENTLIKYCTDSSYGYNGYTDGLTELLPEDDAATANWGDEWQMPSKVQLEELLNSSNTTVKWTQNGFENYGLLITSTSNGNSIFLPAGGRYGDDSFYLPGSDYPSGYYWARTIYNSLFADILWFNRDEIEVPAYHRYIGQSVRPVRAEPEVYTNFDEETGTLTYYYDKQRRERTGITEVYDPVNNPNAVRFSGYHDKVLKAVIDPSMKNVFLASMCNMFHGRYDDSARKYLDLSSMTSIEGLENLNTSNVTNMGSMFRGCSSLTTLDLSSFNTQNVTHMSFMFRGCSSLAALDLSSFNTQKVEYLDYMFNECSSLTTLDLSSFDTRNVKSMESMFRYCQSLTTLDLSSFDTQNVESMESMFVFCSSLTTLDVSCFNTQNVTTFKCMFACSSLETIDISSFDISNATDIYEMFYCCSRLKTIYCDDDWSTATIASAAMFFGCTSLVGGKGTVFDSNVVGKTYARPDGGESKPGYFTLTSDKLQVYTEFVESTGTLTYYYDDKRETRTGVTELYDPVGNPDAVRFTGYYKKVKKAVIDPSMKQAPLTSMYSMFFGGINGETFAFQVLSNMTEVKGMENLNTADVTRMDWMFEACNSLQTIDVSSFDVSKVTKMDYMFGDCYKLTTIYCNDDWSNTSASSFYMFATCTSLVGGKGTTFDSEVKDKTYARPDGGTESPGYFTEKPSLQGDLNGDGKVDIADAVTVLNIMAAGGYNASADLNGDGKNDIADFVTILNIMAAQ